MITAPTSVFCVCAAVTAGVLWAAEQRWAKHFFSLIPAVLLLCYIPACLGTAGVIPRQSDAYGWMRDYLLPFGLFLLILTTDVRKILRVGPRALFVMAMGAIGVMVGSILSYALFRAWLPPQAWTIFAAISGSWIGGGLSFAAVKEAVGMPPDMVGPAIVIDATIGYLWLSLVLFMARHQGIVNRLYRPTDIVFDVGDDADHAPPARGYSASDILIVLGVGFVASCLCMRAGHWIHDTIGARVVAANPYLASLFADYTLGVTLLAALGLALSFTGLRRLEARGAIELGYGAQFLYFTSLGAQAEVSAILKMPLLLVAGAVWLLVHVLFLMIGARIVRAPLGLPAVASVASLNGPSNAAIVGAEYQQSLAAVGLLLGLLGHIVGSYAGLIVAVVLRFLAP